MLRLYFIVVFRSLWNRKLHTSISVLSLSIGLLVFSFAFTYAKRELSFDQSWPNASSIHRLIVEHRNFPNLPDRKTSLVDSWAWPIIGDHFSAEVDSISRHYSDRGIMESSSNTYLPVHFVDPSFTKIFQLESLEGDLDRVLQGPGLIAIEEDVALRLGDGGRIGEPLLLRHSYTDVEQSYVIGAIYRLPPHISEGVSFESLAGIHDYSLPLFSNGDRRLGNWQQISQIWVALRRDIGTEEFNAMQPRFISEEIRNFDDILGERGIEDHLFYTWQPITDLHFDPSEAVVGPVGQVTTASRSRVAAFSLIGTLVLLVGCSNAISLNMAANIERRREIGILKTNGALPRNVAFQYFGESLLQSLLAVFFSIIGFELLTPVLAALLPFFAALESGAPNYAWMLLVGGLTGILCAAYPAALLSNIRPQVALNTHASPRHGHPQRLRTFLVAAKFSIAAMLLFSTVAIFTQLEITRRQPVGFSLENVVYLPQSESMSTETALLNAINKIPGIIAIEKVGALPLSNNYMLTKLVRQQDSLEEVQVRLSSVGNRFFELLAVPTLAGREFDAQIDNVARSSAQSGGSGQVARVVINRAAANALGFRSPEDALHSPIVMRHGDTSMGVDVRNTPVTILGVVEDTQFHSLKEQPTPEVYVLTAQDVPSYLLIKYEDRVEQTIQASIQAAAEDIGKSGEQRMRFMEEQLKAVFQQERNEAILLLACTVLAVIMASIGLYGLSALIIRRSIKSVGIRMVFGASSSTIARLYLWRFAWPVCVSGLITCPVAVYFILRWIQQFPYQLDLSGLLLLSALSIVLLLLIAITTVGSIIASVLRAKPAKAIIYE